MIELLETFASQSALAIVNARLYRELETQSRELEIASNHKSEFLASMSHELRTPLNAVIGFSEVLLERMFGEINERQEEYLRDIWNSGRHLLELLNEILDLSKVEAGQMVLEPSTFSRQQRPRLHAGNGPRARGGARHHDLGGRRRRRRRDRRRRAAIQTGASSTCCPTRSSSPPTAAACPSAPTAKAPTWSCTVTDTGIGVPPEDQERIFESFQQGRRGPAKEEGTGLGLTLSRRIVGLFGGRMWLESTVGVGSTFGFSIPVRRGRATRPTHGRTASSRSWSSSTTTGHRWTSCRPTSTARRCG